MSVVALPLRTAASTPSLTVDLDAVAANVELLARRATGELMAVVKADGFGHGAAAVARTALAHGATRLGVTSIEEARALRSAGLTAPILSWLNPVGADWGAAVAARVDLAVASGAQLDAIVASAPGAVVHLHLDTGLARDGAAPTQWADLCRAARRAERRGLLRVDGVMGHLPCADQPGHAANAVGRTRFAWGVEVARAAGLRPVHRHLAATSATLTDPLSHHTMSRVGAGLVGIDPSAGAGGGAEGGTRGGSGLRPALTLSAPLVQVRRVPAGTPVGYGHTWTAPRATTLGLLALGYADGLPRAASGRAEISVGDELGPQRRPLVGRISMDTAVVDLGPDAHCVAGDLVVVFGPGDRGEPTAADWARWAGTLEHEIVTGIGHRVHRVHPVVA